MLNKYPALSQRPLRQVMARTALTREEMDKPLQMLSGGEQSKVKLADLMLQPSNVLVMDEPTITWMRIRKTRWRLPCRRTPARS